MTKLNIVVMQTLHLTEQRLKAVEYKVAFGASYYVFPLSALDENKDFDRNLYKKSKRNKLDALLASSVGDNVGNSIRSLMPRLLRKQVMFEVNYTGAHSKFAFRRTALHDFLVGSGPNKLER
ncbi:hypothetical protein FGIG_08156 [Fasciola gigantica]|uniref:Uncharacterized protein n=1 Tax=Fasciola gigantica TaxID=46835 RepID=A0A504Z389_FASGI|nr:hypothetical protein FGIG_08156 [Fasciola gigantica]